MDAADMDTVAGFILEALATPGDDAALARLRERVVRFASGCPVPGVTDA
jgi:hypothetical protein